MKVMKKIFSIILIFIVIQLIGVIFVSNESYAGNSFFEDAFSSGKKWKEMGKDSESLIENANGVFNATQDIYDGIRSLGIGLFMVNIAVTAISLSMHNNGKDIAGIKLTIGFTFLLAILFIFAQQIMDFLKGIFEQFEGLM